MKFKRILALVTASALTASVMTGVAYAKTKSKSKSNPYKNHLTISIAHWGIGDAIPGNGDALLKTLEKKFNVTIKPVNITWDDFDQKVKLWAVSNSLPDVFSEYSAKSSDLPKWISSKRIRALPSNLNAYPNIKKFLSQSEIEAYKYPFMAKNSKYYSIPRENYQTADWWANNNVIMVRKDWMKKVGVKKLPTNMTDFTSLMKKFVNNDPDGDKKADTVGLTAYDSSWLYPLFLGYEPAVSDWTKDKTGKWIPGFMTNNAVKGITAIKKLNSAGGLDKDIATIKGTEGQDKFTTGRAGAYAWAGDVVSLETLVDAFKKTYGNKWKWADHIALLKPFKATDGKYYHLISNPASSETYFSGKDSDEKVNRVLAMLNWGFTTNSEGFKLFRYGVKGTDYTEKNGKITIKTLDLQKKYPSAQMANWWGWFADWQYTKPGALDAGMQKQAYDLLKWQLKNSKPEKTNLSLSFMNYDGKDKEDFIAGDEVVKAITSKDAASEWKQMVSNYKKAGYNEIITSLNANAKKYGITGFSK